MLENWLRSSFNIFSKSLLQGRAPHSLIIAGNPNLGGARLAIECAKLYLCLNRHEDHYCNSCKSCLQFNELQTGSHPDFIALLSSTVDESDKDEDLTHFFRDLIVNMEGAFSAEEYLATSENKVSNASRSVRVDGIRKLNEWVSEGSVFSHGKVAVISNAHTMLDSASNALLKTFEEPPADTMIILLTRAFEDLPPTLLSRATKIQIPAVRVEDSFEYLKQRLGNDFEELRAKIALSLADGSPTGALQIYYAQKDKVARDVVQKLETVISCNDTNLANIKENELVDLLNSLTPSESAHILQKIVTELLKYKSRCKLTELVLLAGIDLSALCRLPATHLFEAFNDLKFIRADGNLIPSRAPIALIKAWIQALKRKDN
ncbi:MAG: hypothetical protein IJ254_10470 [Succinivibrio sp.]|jgi:DNA polymerase III delta prime subunit|nr:hypothetical protein [Succinivibrio sp.]